MELRKEIGELLAKWFSEQIGARLKKVVVMKIEAKWFIWEAVEVPCDRWFKSEKRGNQVREREKNTYTLNYLLNRSVLIKQEYKKVFLNADTLEESVQEMRNCS